MVNPEYPENRLRDRRQYGGLIWQSRGKNIFTDMRGIHTEGIVAKNDFLKIKVICTCAIISVAEVVLNAGSDHW